MKREFDYLTITLGDIEIEINKKLIFVWNGDKKKIEIVKGKK